MKINKIFTGNNRQRNVVLVVFVIAVMFIVGSSISLRLSAYDDYLPGESVVGVTTTRTPQNVYVGVSVSVIGMGEDSTQLKVSISNDFIIAVESQETQDNAVLIYYVNDDYEHKVIMTGTGDDRYVGTIPGYTLGSVIKYQVYMRIGNNVGRSAIVSYTVQTEPDTTTDPLVIPIQDQTPPEFNLPTVVLTNGEELTFEEFKGALVYGTVTFEMSFTKGGNNIWGIGLRVFETSSSVNSVDRTLSFVLKPGTDYTWILSWDTTEFPDGVYEAQLIVKYWEGVVRPTSEGEIIDLPFATFSFGVEDGRWSIAIDYTVVVAVISVAIIVVIVFVYMKEKEKGRRKRK